MAQDAFTTRDSEADTVETSIRFVGTGAANPTKVYGKGVAITRTGAGAYSVVFSENPGNYVGFVPGLDATTPADLAGHTVIGKWTAATLTFSLVLYNASFAAHDLAALEWINLELKFKRTSVS